MTVQSFDVRRNGGVRRHRLADAFERSSSRTGSMTASARGIRHANVATAMVAYLRSYVLSQAAASALAEANQLPQGVRTLLR